MIQAPVLLLHGFLGTAEDWGGSPHVAVPWFDQFGSAASLHKVADLFFDFYSIRYQTVTLVGYSMGGRLALLIAERYPHWVSQLVVLSAHPGGLSLEDAQRRFIQEKEWQSLMLADWVTFLDQWYRQPLFSLFRQSAEFALFFKQKSATPDLRWAQKLIDFSVRHQDSSTFFFSHKFEYRVGQEDRAYLKISEELAQKNPNATVRILPNCDHRILFY